MDKNCDNCNRSDKGASKCGTGVETFCRKLERRVNKCKDRKDCKYWCAK